MGSCRFCAIVQGVWPAEVVAETDTMLAFLSTRPVVAGHALVIPRVHAETLADLPEAQVGPLFTLARQVASAMEHGLGADGSLVAVKNRINQSIPHVHVHVIPRRRHDAARILLRMRRKYRGNTAGDYAQLLRDALTPTTREPAQVTSWDDRSHRCGKIKVQTSR